ncbi:MAG TPA: ATP-dependent zinc metalloprotease FtsH [Gemmataceae bacterium]|nr:ATP-dependent zinc metalloprotease FtsH [Gemmataceae bacterium]
MPSDPTPPNTPKQPGKPRRKPAPGLGGNWLVAAVILFVIGLLWWGMSMNSSGALTWGEFLAVIKDPNAASYLKNITFIDASTVKGDVNLAEFTNKEHGAAPDLQYLAADKLKSGTFTVHRFQVNADDDVQKTLLAVQEKALQNAQKESKPDAPVQPTFHWDQQTDPFAGLMSTVLFIVLPLLVIGALFFFVLPRFRDPLGGGFLSNYIKSPAKRYERSRNRITFDDVAGMQNAKSELQEVVEFLRDPQKFQRLGAVVPKGVLLVGPPGTGKTLLAKAVAGEAGVPFFSISGSEFIQMFVGVGASRVRDMFKTAKDNAPCILFIDEIDAVGRMRGAGVGGGSDEREQTLNQILSEMDGFTPTESVIVMAATNRPDVLDSALLRPGRFDRHITVDRPTWQGRAAILKVHTRNKPLADDVNLEEIARGLIGMTGADLRNLANEAALVATREGKSRIDRRDFAKAADRVLMGAKREEVLSAEEKRRTAYHEAGHALVSWLVPEGERPHKVSIIPRGRSLGVTMYQPDEDRHDHGLDYWKAQLATAMGGRAADRLIYGQAFSGHENDLKQASKLARYMVTHWGMSERLGPMSFRIGEEHVFLGKEIQEPRDFSDGTATIIDEEVQRILREADDHAYKLLEAHRDKMERLVEALLQHEELLRDEIDAIFRAESNGVVTGPPVGIVSKE